MLKVGETPKSTDDDDLPRSRHHTENKTVTKETAPANSIEMLLGQAAHLMVDALSAMEAAAKDRYTEILLFTVSDARTQEPSA